MCLRARDVSRRLFRSSRVDHAPELVKFAELFAPVRVDAHASSRARASTRPRRALARFIREGVHRHSVKPRGDVARERAVYRERLRWRRASTNAHAGNVRV